MEIKDYRIAAIDFGLKRVGIAFSDLLHLTAASNKTLIYTDSKFWDDIILVLKSNNVKHIVFGIPLRDDNRNNEFIAKIKEFANKINELYPIDIEYYDESFSSSVAKSKMIESGIKKKDRSKKGALDRIAASVILQNYLDEKQ